MDERSIMKIFIWKMYGDVKVYAVETVEQAENLFYEIVSCVDEWDMDKEVEFAKKEITKSPVTVDRIIEMINYLLKVFSIGSHESFEFGTGFSVLKQ